MKLPIGLKLNVAPIRGEEIFFLIANGGNKGVIKVVIIRPITIAEPNINILK